MLSDEMMEWVIKKIREHCPPDFPALDLIHMWVVRLRSYLMASYGSGGNC